MLDRGLRPGATVSYRSIIQAGTHVFLSRLLESLDEWETHLDLFELLSSSRYVLNYLANA